MKLHLLTGASRYLLLLSLCCWGFSTLHAQVNVIKISPQNLILRGLNPSFERVIKGPHSLAFGMTAILPWNALNTAESIGIEASGDNWSVDRSRLGGFRLTAAYRFYFLKEAPRGAYAGIFLRSFRYQASNDFSFVIGQNTEAKLNSRIRFQGLGPGFDIGYQQIFKNGISLDFNLGLGIGLSSMRLKGDFTNLLQEELGPAIERANEYLDQIPLINVSIPNQESFEINAPVYAGPWPILRTNVALGYAF